MHSERVFALSSAVSAVLTKIAENDGVTPKVALARCIIDQATERQIDLFPKIVPSSKGGVPSVVLIFAGQPAVRLTIPMADRLALALAGKVTGDQRLRALSGGLLRVERRRGVTLELPNGYRYTLPTTLAAMLADKIWRGTREALAMPPEGSGAA